MTYKINPITKATAGYNPPKHNPWRYVTRRDYMGGITIVDTKTKATRYLQPGEDADMLSPQPSQAELAAYFN